MSTKEKRELKKRSAAESILWATVEKLAKSEFTRDELVSGKYEVNVAITGEVDGEVVEAEIESKVNIQGGGVYHPSIKAPADHLLAILWSHLPETVRLRLASELPPYYEEHKMLPEVDPDHLSAIEKLTKRLTARGPAKPKAGSITATRV